MTQKIYAFQKLSRPSCQGFATHFWIATHSLGNADIEDYSCVHYSYITIIIIISVSCNGYDSLLKVVNRKLNVIS
jgi:hypothetical protein